MAPSAALQSRISAFEALQAESNRPQKVKAGVHLPPLKVSPNVVEIINGQSILESDPASPTADSLIVIPPIKPVSKPSRPSSPIALGRKSSLIDFSELSSTSPGFKPISINGTGSTTSSGSISDSYKILYPNSPPPPPLPPRKASNVPLKITPPPPPPLPKRHASSTPVPSSSSGKTLVPPPDTHSYPPIPSRGTPLGPPSRHIPSSSTSSFHSVSLSSDGGGDTRDSLDGSYETVSSTAATSLTTHDSEYDRFQTPKLPQRTWQTNANLSSAMKASSPASRRPPPPPPRRELKPDTVVLRSPPTHRPAPLPPEARKRYDALFELNLPKDIHRERAAGWRGLSVDLIDNDGDLRFDDEISNVPRLDGSIVKQIWTCSKLPKSRLRQIWGECDSGRSGSLDKDAFAKGMWQIDDELRRGQNHPRPSSLKDVRLSYAPRGPPPPLRKPNFLR